MILIFSAPSGSGKSTMVRHLLETFPDTFELSISATTRAPRGEEVNGREYYFLTVEEFEKRVRENKFVEHEQVYEGLYYGTLRSEIERIENAGHHVLFDVDVKGGINLHRIFGSQSMSIFICPPSVEELDKRLHARGDTSEEMIQKRIAKAAIEMEDRIHFDQVIVNDQLPRAFDELDKIISTWLGQKR
ncbi:MAG: guanylate kinase [Paludibacteraceae bacterium]|nr:guanylate kinase [Paludibacteraceae bacterium]